MSVEGSQALARLRVPQTQRLVIRRADHVPVVARKRTTADNRSMSGLIQSPARMLACLERILICITGIGDRQRAIGLFSPGKSSRGSSGRERASLPQQPFDAVQIGAGPIGISCIAVFHNGLSQIRTGKIHVGQIEIAKPRSTQYGLSKIRLSKVQAMAATDRLFLQVNARNANGRRSWFGQVHFRSSQPIPKGQLGRSNRLAP